MSEPKAQVEDGWTDVRERGSLWAMKILFTIYRWGGCYLALPIVYCTVFYFFIRRASTRRHSRYYLQRATGAKPSLWLIWRHHMAFARALLDRLGAWMGRINIDQVSFPDRQTMIDLQAKGRGCILLGTHFGNLEMCRALEENDNKLTLNVILHTGNTENYNALLASASELSSVRLIQVADITPATAIMLKNKLDDGEFLILLADRLPPGNAQRYYTAPFLGTEARFPTGPFWLALMLDAPVFFIAGYDTGNGYNIRIAPLRDAGRVPRTERDDVCQAMLTDYIKELEPLCQTHPLQWFNFFDYWGDERSTDNNSRSDVPNEQ
ncbi:LpxL/LpxP family acyltransferase [Gilvimarinus polysaccharolyticus]|uniref:LpxL/LpxP family acyltransferase n=1 Tax=Gilvimarinus polysaccharolyticus TaxID=863921 RepID=UPI00067352EE|nr:hypothetical protein [Gilvimarinus polysaccharolyticus]